MSYQKLAKLSGPDQQFYGLQPYGLDGKHEPQACIEDMARAYIDEIRRIQPRGPYRIGGVCLGGVMSFEMAQQLKADGQEVSLLLLIDSDFPARPEHLHIRSHRLAWIGYHLGEVLRLPVAEKAGYLVRLLVAEKAEYLIRRARHAVRRIVRNSPLIGFCGANESSLTRATRHVKEINLRAVLNYSPRIYPGRVTLFCCSERSTRSYEDRRLAWSQVAGDGLEMHLIPGNHRSMVDHPHVQVMADKLRACLERARRTGESGHIRACYQLSHITEAAKEMAPGS